MLNLDKNDLNKATLMLEKQCYSSVDQILTKQDNDDKATEAGEMDALKVVEGLVTNNIGGRKFNNRNNEEKN